MPSRRRACLPASATKPAPFLVLADKNGTVPQRTHNAGRITPEMSLSPAEWNTFAQGANSIARAVREATGLRTVFHHHCAGYVETPDEIARFLERELIRKLLGLVFDTGHYVFGSGDCDVLAGLERFKERIWYVHLKDCSQDVARKIAPEAAGTIFSPASRIFCELGRGCVDFPECCDGWKNATMTVMFWWNRMCCPEWARRNTAHCAIGNICARMEDRIRVVRARGRHRLTEKRLQIGIIGAGRIGRVHAETLAFRIPEAAPAAIADVNGEAAQRSGGALRDPPRSCRAAVKFSSDPAIDAVLICSPTETHADLVIEAARAGKHIFCEKPIDHSLSNIDRALQEVKNSGVKFQVGFNRRFDANFVRVRSGRRAGRDRDAAPDAHHQPRSRLRRRFLTSRLPAEFSST